MRRPLLLLITALALLAPACAPPGPATEPGGSVDSQRDPTLAGAPATREVVASCPVTRPPRPAFVPPAPFPRRPPPLYGDVFWYGSERLWTWLEADGTARRSDKSFWWREGYDWQAEPSPPLLVTARRLDGTAPAVASPGATNGFRDDIGAFMLTGLDLPTGGCWEVTGHYRGQHLRFVVRVR